MDAATIAETLRQIIEGEDFNPPAKMLKISAKRACSIAPGAPYSIATNVWHADYWNRLWLAKLRGEKFGSKNIWADDWQVPTEKDWPETRDRFLANLTAARELALATPFSHALKSDSEALDRLHRIAAHTAYHVGQIALLKRLIG
jgi:uncharacterized damage-inducible protein DinB